MPAGSTYTPIATTTLGSNQSTIQFNSISGSYTDLIIVGSFAINRNGAAFTVRVGNGSVDSGNNYSITDINGNGSTAASERNTNQPNFSIFPNIGCSTTVGNNNVIIQFMNYSNTTTYKTILVRENNTDSSYPGTAAGVGLWRSTSAIDTINLIAQVTGSDAFVTGSTFTLYGIASA